MARLKRLKDIDIASRAHFFRVYFWTLFPLLFIMFFAPVGFLAKIMVSLLGAFVTTIVVVSVTNYLGRSAGMLYSGAGPKWTLREQLEGDLSQARISRAEKNYEQALITLEAILARDPDFPDALLLKAQVLWEGFADDSEARKCVMQVLHVEPDKASPVYRWAGELYKEITRGRAQTD